jgi:hypothetical protein
MPGHLSVIKGAAPSLHQLDTIAPLAPISAGQTPVTRGSLMYLAATGPNAGKFVKTGDNVASHGDEDTAGPIVHWALHDAGDPDVKMARVMAAYPCTMPLELETSSFDDAQTYALGQKVMAGADGKLVPHVAGATAIGSVTVPPAVRWINNAVAVPGERTGNRGSVITIQTMYLPRFGAVAP